MLWCCEEMGERRERRKRQQRSRVSSFSVVSVVSVVPVVPVVSIVTMSQGVWPYVTGVTSVTWGSSAVYIAVRSVIDSRVYRAE